MYDRLQQERDTISQVLEAVMQHATGYLQQLPDRPPAQRAEASVPQPLSSEGVGFATALQQFSERWQPQLSASAGPRYLGFITGGATPAALAGDWLTSALDQNPMNSLDGAGQLLEREALAWLRDLFDLPAEFAGSFVSGATVSNMVGLAIAREWCGEQRGISVADDGHAALGKIEILSGATHSSVYKAAAMLGIGRKAIQSIALLPDREAVDVAALEQALAARADQPVIVVANAGTVNSVDFDDLTAIAALRARYPFWLHVDAAFGAFARLLPQHADKLKGLELADSVCIDLHKWLNVPYDSAVQFSRRQDLQVRVFQNASVYLGMPTGDPDFVHLTPENSRRFRALPAWFSLLAYGRAGHADIVARNVALADALSTRLAQEPRLQLLAPTRLNVVCFSLTDRPTAERIQTLVRLLRDDGEVFLTPTVYQGTWGVRAAFSNWRTEAADIDRIVAALARALERLG
ncbi:aspartate aminotransferase family protein [Permianibacter sp. IMCC34836]|uniref:pyridoxal phosphate-dependent decarboxylase family protein n=1 Tax=Permianibacter fluminis TaxID=2738515 RepID=UPI001553CDEC|nr:pyridoxal-dependent decarboxylase [Permianibacter fluminis]NQD37594.1 aspartate aminotransferase family protein [Permianibacter fluminis]